MLTSRVMNECLSLRGVSKSYHAGVRGCSATIAVLRDLDLTVDAGEIIAISATPGAGKTTLMMCAAGLIRPDRGFVSWFGGPFRRDGAARPDGIAFASDRPFPYGFLSVREALEYAAIARDLPLRDNGRRVATAMERTRLELAADRRVDSLKGSDLARMAIASAILAQPRLLLVDDVASGCAPDTAHEIVALLRTLSLEGAAVVVTGALCQWLSATSQLAPRMVALVGGRLVSRADPASPTARPVSVGYARVAEVPPSAPPR
jgi:ABC-type multidrug transport system ATPase subunit